MDLYKRYVDVILMQKKTGEMLPMYVCWDNGKKYKIDRILNAEKRASPVGGCGIRYACMIQGKRRHLYLEKDRWFIESTQP